MRASIAVCFALSLSALVGFPALADGDANLADAMMNRDVDTVHALLETKADVNAPGRDGTPALDWAVRYDDLDTAKLLVTAGADVNAKTRYGITPLYLASRNGNVDMIDMLLDAKANPNATDNTGETMLMAAVRGGSADAVAALLKNGAEVDAREPHFQQTALMIAVREDHPDIVRTPDRPQGRRECADPIGRRAEIPAAQFEPGLARYGHRPRRMAGARHAESGLGSHDAAPLCRAGRSS